MSDTPKFEVIDRRKFKAEEEQESSSTAGGAGRDTARRAELRGRAWWCLRRKRSMRPKGRR